MEIQFIIVGWHYNQESFIDGLIELQKDNDNVNVFWSCHKEPPQIIKENFNWKLFNNLGLEYGAYQQALDHLNLEDDDICFFCQDDIIIKDWNFIYVCLRKLNGGIKFLGNGINYPTEFSPDRPNKIGGVLWDFVKEENKHLHSGKRFIRTLRGSFICTKYQYVKNVGYFEPAFNHPDLIEPYQDENGDWKMKHQKGLGGMGNTLLALFSYKINIVYGLESIDYLGNKYLDSDFIYECARGKIDEKNPMT